MAKNKAAYPHAPREYHAGKTHGTFCLNDGQAWPCTTARKAQTKTPHERTNEESTTNG